ncbi:MAG: 2,5-diamino-6-(ribosylamino)-4(3H)-pyrimidinone 5'-phosphate reductase [Caeruleum heppii]|nr:MAG: 2,5-diamino-6-(ribosylamino)-4(3H)-pyrimidinone 5'-phosphate reductase [Caeruleum heppii]
MAAPPPPLPPPSPSQVPTSTSTLTFSPIHQAFLKPYLPSPPSTTSQNCPSSSPPTRPIHITLTYATSLDSSLALTRGALTPLSGPRSKSMTHFLRSRHDAILVGVGTAVADDPGLNCRLAGVERADMARPVVLDPRGRWDVDEGTKVVRMAREEMGKGVWVLVGEGVEYETMGREVVEKVGGKVLYVPVQRSTGRMEWSDILQVLSGEGIRSVMVEGGGTVINDLLQPDHAPFVTSLITTIAPVYLGRGGVVVSPDRRLDEHGQAVPAARIRDVTWHALGDDMILCGRPDVA